jgi:cell division control protein 45
MGPRKPRDAENSSEGDVSYNKFGSAFQTTANKINAKVRMDAFESSIIEVAKDDLARFLEALAVSGMIR